MSVIFEAENYRGLKKVRWAPSGVCALVGPNGSGKTTLLRLPELFRYAVQRGFNEAVGIVGGFWGLKNLDASDADFITLRATAYGSSYTLRVAVKPNDTFEVEESLRDERGDELLRRDFGEALYTFLGKKYYVKNGELCLKLASYIPNIELDLPGAPQPTTFINVLTPSHVYRRYRLDEIQENGSRSSGDIRLIHDGTNVFDLLRVWLTGGYKYRWRYDFVIDTLREAFPGTFRDLDFPPSSQRVMAQFYSTRSRTGIPFRSAPDGLLVGLLHLCAIAGMDFDDYVAIDEMENALHPHAIRTILHAANEWKDRRTTTKENATLVLATHSPVVLDCFRDEKENVFVMEPGQEVQPKRITELADPNWLAQFSLGQVYMDGEIGGPILDKQAPEAA